MYRCLLHHVCGPTKFSDLKTVGEKTFATFTEAAQQRGLLASDDVYYRAMEDAGAEKSNFKQLQRYFAMLLFHGRPSNPLKFFEDFIDSMNPPVSVNNVNILPKSKEVRGAKYCAIWNTSSVEWGHAVGNQNQISYLNLNGDSERI